MADNAQSLVLVIAGPTGSGKSALAVDLAERLDGVVINADSLQVYRDLAVLTARPDEAALARTPHRLFGILGAEENCSAARWRDLALKEIDLAVMAGRCPIVCGGTGLYLKALMEGLSPMPNIPPGIRERLEGRLAREGNELLHRELAAHDPASAAKIPASDSQRLIRALEVLEATGRPLADWQRAPKEGPPPDLAFCRILLLPPREPLSAALDARFSRMVAEGALEEVRRLVALNIDPRSSIMKAVGVRELSEHLDEGSTLEESVAAAQQATRQYAKRQYTWFQNQFVADISLDTQYMETNKGDIFSFILEKVLTRLN